MTFSRPRADLIPVADLIGRDLPPRYVVNLLFEAFANSTHWFMLVFHEPSLRAELEEILATGMVSRHKLPWMMLVITILATGATYTPASVIEKSCPGWNLVKLRTKLIRVIEERFLDLFDSRDVEAVAVCVLLSSYYMYHGQLERGWVTLGAAWRAAESMRLHQEHTWSRMDLIQIEVRRRVWWALYVADA